MADGWLAVTWIAVFLVMGAVIAVWLLTRAKTRQTQAAEEVSAEYERLLAKQCASTEEFARELSRLDDRLSSIEGLLRDVG